MLKIEYLSVDELKPYERNNKKHEDFDVGEIWKDIVGFEGLYQVSNLGNVKSLKGKEPKILKGHKDTKGYLQVELRKDNKRNISCIHRLVAKEFLEKPKGKDQINHIDGNKLNNNVDNLEWCTCKENIKHAWDNHLNKATYGENHPNSKLTNEQAKWIKENCKPRSKTMGVQAMANMFGVSVCPIYNIVYGKGWKHI